MRGIEWSLSASVKGRVKGAETVMIAKNEMLACLNQPERFIVPIVLIDGDRVEGPFYLNNPFDQEPDFGVTSVNHDLDDLLLGVKRNA